MIGGKWVLQHREFQTIDLATLRARVAASVERLREQSADSADTRRRNWEIYFLVLCRLAARALSYLAAMRLRAIRHGTSRFKRSQSEMTATFDTVIRSGCVVNQ